MRPATEQRPAPRAKPGARDPPRPSRRQPIRRPDAAPASRDTRRDRARTQPPGRPRPSLTPREARHATDPTPPAASSPRWTRPPPPPLRPCWPPWAPPLPPPALARTSPSPLLQSAASSPMEGPLHRRPRDAPRRSPAAPAPRLPAGLSRPRFTHLEPHRRALRTPQHRLPARRHPRYDPGRSDGLAGARARRLPRLGERACPGRRSDHPDGHHAAPPRPHAARPCGTPGDPEDPLASDLDADLIAALHAQAAGLHNIRALVSVVLDPTSSHYPR
jgi:hypothetical protein